MNCWARVSLQIMCISYAQKLYLLPKATAVAISLLCDFGEYYYLNDKTYVRVSISYCTLGQIGAI